MRELETVKRELGSATTELSERKAFEETVKKAVEQYLAKKYAPLTKAQMVYGGDFEEIRVAYGYGFISRRAFDKLSDLRNEKENDSTAQLMEEVVAMLQRREADLVQRIDRLHREIEEIDNQKGGQQ